MWWQPSLINTDYPISALVLYKSGIKVVRKDVTKRKKRTATREERPIMELSDKSLSRLAFVISNTDVEFLSMMTLTYPSVYPSDGKNVKRQLNKFLTYAKRKFGEFSYLWFLEFQRRNAPHIHILTTLDEPTFKQRAIYSNMWAKVVTEDGQERNKVRRVHRHHTAWELIRSEYGAKGYVLKYALKPWQKAVPPQYKNVGRFWGTSRNVKPQPVRTVPANEVFARMLLKNLDHTTANWDVLPRFIYDTGGECETRKPKATPRNA